MTNWNITSQTNKKLHLNLNQAVSIILCNMNPDPTNPCFKYVLLQYNTAIGYDSKVTWEASYCIVQNHHINTIIS